MNKKNPFLTARYEGAEMFCDRKQETAGLMAAVENGRNVTLVAPRRYVKTGLVKNMKARLSRDYEKVYLDIYSMENLVNFVEALDETCVSSHEKLVKKNSCTKLMTDISSIIIFSPLGCDGYDLKIEVFRKRLRADKLQYAT